MCGSPFPVGALSTCLVCLWVNPALYSLAAKLLIRLTHTHGQTDGRTNLRTELYASLYPRPHLYQQATGIIIIIIIIIAYYNKKNKTVRDYRMYLIACCADLNTFIRQLQFSVHTERVATRWRASTRVKTTTFILRDARQRVDALDTLDALGVNGALVSLLQIIRCHRDLAIAYALRVCPWHIGLYNIRLNG